ncbi:hypothetical protein B0H11DRAFT_2275945 [Mycena galericulata]|nr:hypothetical protein B0H11DRAFT_2275945 [Mycena galericulata]
MPPYYIEVLSYYDNQIYSVISVDSPGTVLWTVNYDPDSTLYLDVEDSLGSNQVSHYFQVLASDTGCGSTPEFQWDNQATISSILSSTEIPAFSTSCSMTSLAMTSSGSPPSTQLPIASNGTAPSGATSTGTPPSTQIPTFSPTTTAPPAVTPSATAGLDDCLSKKASCTFTSTSTGGPYPQQTQLGNAFQNCGGNLSVTYHWSGADSVNITDNWSVSGSFGFSLPKALGNVGISGSKGKSETTTITQKQSYSYIASPPIRVALVGTAWFNATFGNMTIENSGKVNHVENVVYFQSIPDTDVSVYTYNCNVPWPIRWNATTAVPINNYVQIVCPTLWTFVVSGLVLLTLAL